MTELTATPSRIVIVDNENSRETEAMCTAFNERPANLWGIDTEQPDAQGGTDRVIYAPQLENGGGAGGFSAGTKCAYDPGAQWFWVMDDDVLVIPEGIERLAKWTDRYDVIQVRASTLTAALSFGSTSSSFRSASLTPSPSGIWVPRATAP